jgi:hypothetical protein
VVTTNILLFLLTAGFIHRKRRNVIEVDPGESFCSQKRRYEFNIDFNSMYSDRIYLRFWLYARLFVLMGISYTAEVVALYWMLSLKANQWPSFLMGLWSGTQGVQVVVVVATSPQFKHHVGKT